MNPDLNSVWRNIKRASRSWRQRDRKIQELLLARHKNNVPICEVDLDSHGVMFLLVDTINEKKNTIKDRRSFNRLLNELVRHLASTLPSLTVKTGHGDKPSLDRSKMHSSGLGVAVETMLSGSPVLFLDAREREAIVAKDRTTLIQFAKEKYVEETSKLLQSGLCETFDAMTIAYFHEVLSGDGDPATTVGVLQSSAKSLPIPLFLAIERAECGRGVYDETAMLPPATSAQVDEFASWIQTILRRCVACWH
jgi:hypothetical protein